ncbi:hypothetical protein E4T56_gene13224 [Termitomyces sp. T112]|nr:hypothetical protein E4T56_gene13224 [Termitomyces sp. T112]
MVPVFPSAYNPPPVVSQLYAPHPQTYAAASPQAYAAAPALSVLSGHSHNFYYPYNQYCFPDIVQFPPATQPVACTPSIESSSSDTKLPPINTLPCLPSLADWGSWYNMVMMLVDHLGLTGHLCPVLPSANSNAPWLTLMPSLQLSMLLLTLLSP